VQLPVGAYSKNMDEFFGNLGHLKNKSFAHIARPFFSPSHGKN
jgi:hypothetical protein